MKQKVYVVTFTIGGKPLMYLFDTKKAAELQIELIRKFAKDRFNAEVEAIRTVKTIWTEKDANEAYVEATEIIGK
ncbi:MAG: hypothetical protein V4721_12495 [Bacteroidota bacterium]